MAQCVECELPLSVWHHVMLCDRCLAVQSWERLQADDHLLVRVGPTGEIWITSNIGGTFRSTLASSFAQPIELQVAERLRELLAA